MTRNGKKIDAGISFSIGFILIFFLSMIISFTPVFDTETIQYQKAYYDADKTIFATYFYWYQSNGSISNGQQILREVGAKEIEDINNNIKNLPTNWPGPNSIEQIVSFNATGNGKNYKNSISRAPLGFAPTYDSKGEIIGDLPREAPRYSNDQNGILYNLSTFIDWNNPAWHEWEMRCMMRAGIDVLMPVYWWEGPVYSDDSHWSRQGLFTLNNSIAALRAKVDIERQNGGKYSIEDLPKIAMFYDTTLLKMMWARNVTADPNSIYFQNWTKAFDGPGADLENNYWKNEFYLRIEEFFDVIINNPQLYVSTITINGRVEESCVVWLYSASWVDNVGSSVFNYAREKFKAKFGKNLVFIGEGAWNTANIDGICSWGASLEMKPAQYSRIPVGGLGPGYYNVGAIEVQPAIYKNRTIEEFKKELKETVRTGAAWFHIETWNELLEGTDICWTYQNGFARIDAVREFADWFHTRSATDMVIMRLNFPLIIAPFLSFVMLAAVAYYLKKK